MNKFLKFPLLLAIVGVICAGSLSVVYEVTKTKIAENDARKAEKFLSEIQENMTSFKKVKDKYDANKLEENGITEVYELYNGETIVSYGYQVTVNGYNPGIKFLLVLSATDETIVGLRIIAHDETKGGSYGARLLNSDDFAAQFDELSFAFVDSGVDFVAGSTAGMTLNAVKKGVNKVISLHKQVVFGEVVDENKVYVDAIKELVADAETIEIVTEEYEKDTLAAANIEKAFSVTVSGSIKAYAYLGNVTGYAPGIKFLLVVSATENKVLAFKVMEHNETPGGHYGGPLLDSPDFAAQFKDLAFDDIATEVDYVAGSTAKITLSAVLNGVDAIISFYKEFVKGEEGDGINLSTAERLMVNLPEGYVMTDKSSDFDAALKANTSANKYNSIISSLGLLNFVEITDAEGNIKGHAYIVEGKYNCEVEHGQRAWQTYKFVFMFDENGANTQLIVVNSTDSLGAIGQPSIGEQAWIAENFNGFTVTELGDALANDEIDYIHGATFSSNAIKAHVSSVVDAHSRAYGN